MFVLQFESTLSAQVSIEQSTVELFCALDEPNETQDHFLADQVIPRILAHQGKLVLHAGGIEAGGRALAIMGESGRGKSTLVASLAQSGHRIISDDVVVVVPEEGRFLASTTYPSMRLLPDSIASLYPGQQGLTPVAHYTTKQRVPVPPVADGELALAALFVLAPDRGETDITLRRMSAAETCMAIIANSFSLNPADADHAMLKLQQASALASELPAFELSYPRNYARLAGVREAIMQRVEDLF